MWKRDSEVGNWFLEHNSKIRENLLQRVSVYLDFSSCRVVDFFAVSRCNKCQGYGNLAKFSKKEGGSICAHCGQNGYTFRECRNKEREPVCVVCRSAKKPFGHRLELWTALFMSRQWNRW